jgi:enoyl-CoA hydratase/carnithine racemase
LSLVDLKVDSRVALITLRDIKNGNRLNLETLESLEQALQHSISDADVRVVVLRSAAEVFCLGMDLMALRGENRDSAKQAVQIYQKLLFDLHTCSKPTLCILNGDVKAGGVGLTCACDIVLSTENTTFELSEVLFGLIPANVLPYLLLQRIPPQKARYLVLTSRRLSAIEAHGLGLVDEVFPEEGFEKSVRRLIKKLMRSSPSALAEAKDFTRRLQGKVLLEAMEMAGQEFMKLIESPDVTRGISAFNEGDLPDWFERYNPKDSVTEP